MPVYKANDVDGWDFKQYVLGTLFFRFISENFVGYIEGDHTSVDYAAFDDSDTRIELIKDEAKGFGGKV